MTVRWYALRSKPRKEEALWQQVKLRGYEAYYPYLVIPSRRRSTFRRKAYFPGYLFVHVDVQSEGLSKFRWLPYGMGLVCFGGEPAYVPDALVHTMRKRIDASNRAQKENRTNFKQGQPVVIDHGPFEGYEAIFDEHIGGQDRVKVLLELLSGNQIKLELASSQLRKSMQR